MWKKILPILIKTLIIVGIFAIIAVGVYFLLKGLGFTTSDDFIRLRDRLGDSIVFWLVIGLLQIIQVIFVPLSNQIITVPIAIIFPIEDLWKVWITSWISIWIATMILYLLGRFAGKRILGWVLNDKEKTEKCANFLKKGWIFYPLGMLLPLPDDIITTLAGTAKMNFWFVLGCSCLTRAIDTACSVYGWGFLTNYWWGWLLLGIGILLLLVSTIIFWKIQKKIDKKKKEIDNNIMS